MRPRSLVPLVVVACACAWAARVAALVFDGGALAADAFPLLVAHVDALAAALAARDTGLWIHGANLGYPAGTLAPLLPSLLPAALHAAGTDLRTAVDVALFVPLALLPASTWAGLRAAGLASWPAAAAAAATALALSGSRVGLGIEGALGAALLDEAWATLWLPLAAGLGARFLTGGRGLALATAASIACALCHPVVAAALALAWATALFAALATSRRAPEARDPDADPLGARAPDAGPAGVAAPDARALLHRALALAVLLVAGTLPLTLPALLTWSARGAFGPHLDDGDAGFAPARFVPFLATALDGERAPVLILLALCGVLATALRTVRSGSAAAGAPFVAAGATAALVLLAGPSLAWGAVPFGRFAILLQLALCALAGIGVVEVAGAVARAVPPASSRGLAFVVRAALAVSLAALVVLAGAGQLRRARVLTRAIDPALTADLDLVAAARAAPPAARLAAAGPLRTVSRHALAPEGWPGLWSSIGPSVSSSAMADFLSRDDVFDTARITNTGLILVGAEAPPALRPPGRVPVTTAGRFHLYDTGARAYFVAVLLDVPEGEAATDGAAFHERALAWWKGGGARTGRHFVWRHTPAPAGRGKVTVLEEEVAASRFSANLDVATDGPRAVLLKVTWHPWWRASVDGRRVPALRVSPELLAAEVPPGPHTLTFEFVRPWWWALSWLAPALAILGARRLARRGR